MGFLTLFMHGVPPRNKSKNKWKSTIEVLPRKFHWKKIQPRILRKRTLKKTRVAITQAICTKNQPDPTLTRPLCFIFMITQNLIPYFGNLKHDSADLDIFAEVCGDEPRQWIVRCRACMQISAAHLIWLNDLEHDFGIHLFFFLNHLITVILFFYLSVCLLFNGISTFLGYLIPNSSF